MPCAGTSGSTRGTIRRPSPRAGAAGGHHRIRREQRRIGIARVERSRISVESEHVLAVGRAPAASRSSGSSACSPRRAWAPGARTRGPCRAARGAPSPCRGPGGAVEGDHARARCCCPRPRSWIPARRAATASGVTSAMCSSERRDSSACRRRRWRRSRRRSCACSRAATAARTRACRARAGGRWAAARARAPRG